MGYRGIELPGVPFDQGRGIIPNESGRVNDQGLYVSGWIKRGPSGVIGTNKTDSAETVATLLADLTSLAPCPEREEASFSKHLQESGHRVISYEDWQKIDAEEVARGEAVNKPREKIVVIEDMLAIVDKD